MRDLLLHGVILFFDEVYSENKNSFEVCKMQQLGNMPNLNSSQ